MLTVEHLSVQYASRGRAHDLNRPAVQGVSFSLEAESTTVLLGPSGSGKSSIGLAIASLLPTGTHTSGSIWLTSDTEKQALLQQPGTHPTIAWVAQGAQQALSPTRTIRSLLQESFHLHKKEDELFETFLDEITRDLDLDPALTSAYPHQLSGGQRQRCLLALALSKSPALLIADEPGSSLDVLSTDRMLRLLQSIQRKRELSLLLITHNLTIAARLNTHTLYLNQGKILQQGPFSEMISKADSPMASIWSQWTSNQQPAAEEDSQLLLSLDQVSVSYEARGGIFSRNNSVRALDTVSLQVSQGTCVGVFGESGSGKSTLGKAICQLLPYSGLIRWHGDAFSSDPSQAKKVQLILQDSYSSLHPRFTVVRALQEVLRIHQPQNSQDAYRKAALELLQLVHLDEEYLEKFPATLSGGERQRVAIARSLAIQPALLILDESVSSLDTEIQAEVLEVLADIARQKNITLMVISHDFRILRQLCHQVLVLKEGKAIDFFSPGETAHQHHPYTQQLLDAQKTTIG